MRRVRITVLRTMLLEDLAEEQERLLAAAPAPSVPVCILSSKRKIARGDHPWRETVP